MKVINRKTLPILLILALFVVNLFAIEDFNNTKFDIDCRVIGKETLELLDGKSSRINLLGYLPGLGDEFQMNFHLSINPSVSSIKFIKNNKTLEYLFETKRHLFENPSHAWRLGYDSIYIRDLTRGKLSMERFYKNDWQLEWVAGTTTQDGGSAFTIFHANCKNMPDKYDQFVKRKKEFNDSKKSK